MAEVTITGFSHVGIRVHDLERSRKFYELLGFEFIVGPVGPEPVAIMKHPAGIEINFILNAPESETPNVLMDVEGKKPGYTHIALACADLDAAAKALEAAGHEITGRMEFLPGFHGMFVRDPDRNVVELNHDSR